MSDVRGLAIAADEDGGVTIVGFVGGKPATFWHMSRDEAIVVAEQIRRAAGQGETPAPAPPSDVERARSKRRRKR